MLGTCAECGAQNVPVTPLRPRCYSEDANGERIVGTGCYGLLEASEAARLGALGAAIGVAARDVTPARLEVAAAAVKRPWHEVTPEDIAALTAAKRTALRTAVAKVQP